MNNINHIKYKFDLAKLVTRTPPPPPPRNQYLMWNETNKSKQCHVWDVKERNILSQEVLMIKINWESKNVSQG